MYDYGACLEYARNLAKTRTVPAGLENAIFLGYVGDTDPEITCFNTWKDITIPPYIYDNRILAAQGGAKVDPSSRKTIAYFRGTISWELSQYHTAEMNYSNGIRLKIHQSYGNDPMFDLEGGEDEDYIKSMQSSVFCLAPLGYSLWTFRMYEAIILGCIPVIIADNIELPYEDVLDYRAFTVKILESEVTTLKKILTSIPAKVIQEKQSMLRRVWKHFVYNNVTKEGDAFDLMLDSLAGKVRRTYPAAKSSWI